MERNYHYFMDKEGRIWHDGTEITDPRFAYLVQRTIQNSPEGLLVKCQGENCFFEIEDVPYVVQNVALRKDNKGKLQQIDLIFPGGYAEPLDAATLFVGPEDVLYCKVRGGSFCARFCRKSYFELMPYIGEGPDHQSFFLELNGKRYPIEQSAIPSCDKTIPFS